MPGPTAGRRWTSRRFEVHDRSMAPAFLPGDRLLVDLAAYRRHSLAVGDVVVVADPEVRGRLLLKRVAAIGPPAADPAGAAPGANPIPPGYVFVLSDNRRNGRDSRQFGPVPALAVLGRVWFRYAPVARRGPLAA